MHDTILISPQEPVTGVAASWRMKKLRVDLDFNPASPVQGFLVVTWTREPPPGGSLPGDGCSTQSKSKQNRY
jgi:hypothetical protein